MKKGKSVTYRKIADEAKVSVATVTRALKGDPQVRAETAERVRTTAEHLGYVPDPDLARMMRRLRQRDPSPEPETIAYLQHLDQESWMARSAGAHMLRGCLEAAARLGYVVDPIRLPKPPGKGLHKILQARGIRGLLIETFAPDPFPWKLPWEQYATVQLGARPRHQAFHCVDADDHHNVRLAVAEMTRAGYRHIGFVTTKRDVTYDEHSYLGAFIACSGPPQIPYLILEEEDFDQDGAAFHRWLEVERPDAIFTTYGNLDDWLDRLGYRVPEDIALAHANTMDDHPWGGTVGNDPSIGRVAVETLALCLESGKLGLLDPPIIRVIPGRWRFGETVIRKEDEH